MKKDSLPLNWWIHAMNFGDLLSPWLAKRLYNADVVFNNGKRSKTYLAIGSVISKATPKTIVWGSGALGTENQIKYKHRLCQEAIYNAVRGPLTRNLLRINGIKCPSVYGDPALLTPFFYYPDIKKVYEVGIILRWPENKWNSLEFGDGIKKIFLGTDKIEETLDDILSCKRILSSSLHGIIIADAYGIPSAWLDTITARGYNFKYYDYMLAVNKVQTPQILPYEKYRKLEHIELKNILHNFIFDSRQIDIDLASLIEACPFIDTAIKEKLIKDIKAKKLKKGGMSTTNASLKLDKLKSSYSWKIGSAITWPFRTIRHIIKHL